MTEAKITQGTLLGGRVAYQQYQHGHRSGFEPVLMAAMVPARAHEVILDAGTGAGAALLCLQARVSGACIIGIERDPAMARLAARNLSPAQIVNGDATCLPFPTQSFHHVMANPPWFGTHNTPSPDSTRALAHHASPETLALWIAELVRVLRDRGSLTLALPASAYAHAASCLRPACGGLVLFPLWPRHGAKAKIILLHARKASQSPDSVWPGLVLHNETGLTPEAEAVLRDAQPLPLK